MLQKHPAARLLGTTQLAFPGSHVVGTAALELYLVRSDSKDRSMACNPTIWDQ